MLYRAITQWLDGKSFHLLLPMAKRPLRLKIRIPPYRTPRNAWRRKLHRAISEQQRKSAVSYHPTDRLEVEARFYMNDTALGFHDVDNRLKDILDALQGRAGGPKNRRTLRPIIPNDQQVYRVIIEKARVSWQSHGMGHLAIRRLSRSRLVHRHRTRRRS